MQAAEGSPIVGALGISLHPVQHRQHQPRWHTLMGLEAGDLCERMRSKTLVVETLRHRQATLSQRAGCRELSKERLGPRRLQQQLRKLRVLVLGWPELHRRFEVWFSSLQCVMGLVHPADCAVNARLPEGICSSLVGHQRGRVDGQRFRQAVQIVEFAAQLAADLRGPQIVPLLQ
jgi:hypothetical protein